MLEAPAGSLGRGAAPKGSTQQGRASVGHGRLRASPEGPAQIATRPDPRPARDAPATCPPRPVPAPAAARWGRSARRGRNPAARNPAGGERRATGIPGRKPRAWEGPRPRSPEASANQSRVPAGQERRRAERFQSRYLEKNLRFPSQRGRGRGHVTTAGIFHHLVFAPSKSMTSLARSFWLV